MDVIKRIEDLRLKRKWSIYKLAEMSGLSSKCIYNYYYRKSIPTLEMLTKICDAFGITLFQFFSVGDCIDLNDEQKELFDEWSKIASGQKKAVLNMIKTMKK